MTEVVSYGKRLLLPRANVGSRKLGGRRLTNNETTLGSVAIETQGVTNVGSSETSICRHRDRIVHDARHSGHASRGSPFRR